MNTKNAVAERIIELCNQKNIAINALANISGISPSTLYSVLNEKSQNPGIVTIKKLCDGLDISLREFFDDDIFDDIEQEIDNGLKELKKSVAENDRVKVLEITTNVLLNIKSKLTDSPCLGNSFSRTSQVGISASFGL